jgi:transcriptional regulator with XRE-family HTH domain
MRLEVGMSQEALALEADSGRTFISQLERGERGASIKTLFRLAYFLGVSPVEVIARVEAQLAN